MNPEHPKWYELKAQSEDADIGCGDGWDTLVLMTHYALRALDPDYRISQIKEKFGGLRFYMQPTDDVATSARDQMYEIAALAEQMSVNVCEECGSPGAPCTPTRYWIKTLCESCLLTLRTSRGLQTGDTVEDAGVTAGVGDKV